MRGNESFIKETVRSETIRRWEAADSTTQDLGTIVWPSSGKRSWQNEEPTTPREWRANVNHACVSKVSRNRWPLLFTFVRV